MGEGLANLGKGNFRKPIRSTPLKKGRLVHTLINFWKKLTWPLEKGALPETFEKGCKKLT